MNREDVKGTQQNPKISIIVPVYNGATYIEACYESLKNQTYQNLELVFVDDCSKDNSRSLLLNFARVDNRVIVVQTPSNSGVSAARNYGLDKAKGELIGFCDVDDTCEKNMFQNMVSELIKKNADIACCGLKRVNEEGKTIEALWQAPTGLTMCSEEAMKYWLMGKYIGNSVCTKLIKKELWEGVRFPEGQIFEEAYIIPNIMSKAKKIVHTGTVEYNYFTHETSCTAQPVDETKMVVYERERFIREFIAEKYPKLKDAVNCFEIRTNMGMMMGAELSKRRIDKNCYNTIKKEFEKVYKQGIFNRCISVKDKIKLIELRTGMFYLRKLITGKIH